MAGTYADIAQLQTELIRKTISGSVFVGEYDDADLITTITTTTGTAPSEVITLAELPTGYEDLGYLTDDGAAFNTDTTSSDITSFQSVQPTRSDITAQTTTLQVQAQETKLLSLALYTGASKSGITAAATGGEVNIKIPERPSSKFYRVLALGVDETENGELYVARYLPRAKVTGKGSQSFSKADQALLWDVTFTGYKDSVAGCSEQWFFGGPAWSALLTSMGFGA